MATRPPKEPALILSFQKKRLKDAQIPLLEPARALPHWNGGLLVSVSLVLLTHSVKDKKTGLSGGVFFVVGLFSFNTCIFNVVLELDCPHQESRFSCH